MSISRKLSLVTAFCSTMFLMSSAQGSYWRDVVNCDAGESLAKAVKRAYSGRTIYVKGTCHERITIKRDRIKIVGIGDAGLDGSGLDQSKFEFHPLVRVRDAVGVVIKDLFVRNSPAEGLLVEGKATVRLKNVTARSNRNVGMFVDHARVEVFGGAYEGNQAGIDTTNGASAIFRGDVSLQNNGVFGVAASSSATLEARGATMNASGNQLAGVLLEGGTLAIFNFSVSQGSQILANDNGLCGIVMVGGGYMDIIAPPPQQFTGINLVSASNNGNCGILMNTNSIIDSPFGAATFQIAANPVGMQVAGNSNVLINGGLNIVNNFVHGLFADGAGVITLAPADPSPPQGPATSLQNNGGSDVFLGFGSRATFADNVTVGAIDCDSTSLARGSASCP